MYPLSRKTAARCPELCHVKAQTLVSNEPVNSKKCVSVRKGGGGGGEGDGILPDFRPKYTIFITLMKT